jgi:hypothetical protein
MVKITIDELVAELDRLGVTSDDEGLTAEEWSRQWGCYVTTARKRIRLAMDHGLVACGRKTIRRLNGQAVLVPCYRITMPEKKKGKR